MIDVEKRLTEFTSQGGTVYPGEMIAIRMVIAAGEEYGFGNMISWLKEAWSEKLQRDGLPKDSADMAAGYICVWCDVDTRTGEKP